ncbi:dermonecrotic toxin domain-containing protein [Pseudomonas sp. TWP3-1]|uniref:dermonecrotic toxin domain-containing protein n=1 Tax=Pseudomonas sp. TWP3-1 TaxID=2804631 RepID=UPI003CED74DF
MTPSVTAPLLKQSRLVELTGRGFSLHQVATALLQEALLKRYPELLIDPERTMLATPLRDMRAAQMNTQAFDLQSLTHAFIQHSVLKTTADYIEGEHFLTLTPKANPPIHLAVSMDDVTALMNDHAPFLFLEYQQRQLDYWNQSASKQPRWQELSDLLCAAADVQSASGWDADDCALARFVAQHPDKAERPKSSDFAGPRACLLDIDLMDGSDTVHLLIAGALVLTATVKKRERFLMYTVADGYESFDSLTALGESLPGRLDPDLSGRSFKWRLIEPAGNVFDAVSQALVANQLGAIEALDPGSQSIAARAGSGQQNRARFNPVERARVEQLEQAIPGWLHAGSIHDLQAYSACIADLGTLREDADNTDDDIPLIKPYAEEKMREAIIADKTAEGAADLPLEHLRITVTNSLETAGFTLPNPFDRVRETLGEFALQNAAPYQATVAFTDARAVPGWLTVDFLTAKAQEVDIGGQYPQLIKRTLIDDAVRAARQKTRYLRQLPTLLPLLALEYKLKRQGGIDERGYGYVCQLMDSITSKQPDAEHPVTIRPLAFAPRRRMSGRVDTVTNMFVICPRDHRQGPCLLYRPMLDMPLMQFASLQNLMYALYQPGELRNSVIAWLGSAALSFEYSQYVFSTGLPSPWIVTQLAVEPFMHLDLTGPIDLANAPLTGDILAALHSANSQALVELADRQSQSNSERRWALAADSGWALFNVAANFMSGAAGTAVWVWQTITQIQQAIDAHERDDNIVVWQSTADVLLTLGMILTQHAVARRNRSLLPHLKAVQEIVELSPETEDLADHPALPSPTVTPAVTLDPVAIVGDLPVGHLTQLEPGTLLRPDSSARFLAMLESFKIPLPDLSGKSASPVTHLYTLDGKTCTPVGSRWFQVAAIEETLVYIVDPGNPLRSGMSIKYDSTAGRWHWDPKLRLRGGMPKGRIEALRRAKEQRMNSAWTALEQFAQREPEEKRQLLHALVSLPSVTTEAGFTPPATRYLDQAMKLGSDYTAALEQLDIWHNAGGAALLHQSQLMRLTAEQHRCLGSWLRVKMRMYANATQKLIDSTTRQIAIPRSEHIEIANAAIPLSDAMIGTLETLYRSAQVLSSHSGKAKTVAAKLIGLLPDFGPLDLKANEIGMSYERSVNEQPGPAMLAAREAIGIITANAADAAHELILLSKTAVGSAGQAGRIEQLSQWNDLFASLDERIVQLPAAYPKMFIQARLDRVRTLIDEFHALARERLIAELPEQEQLPAPVKPEPQPSTSQPRVKVSKSRPRPDTGENSSGSQSSDSDEKTAFVKLPSQRPRPTAPSDDIELISAAMELNLHIDDFNRKTREDARRPGRIPADIRDLFEQQVARLKQTASDVDMAIARRSVSKADPLPIASLSDDLREGATRTHADGITTYAAMLKQRKPREAYFHWLQSNAQVEVVKDERGRIRTRHRGDYFQEYRILDQANGGKPLWVAHFHYEHMTDADDAYTAAHLKFADAYLLTLDAKTRQTLNSFDAVDNALRRIVDPQVRDLFLKPHAAKP